MASALGLTFREGDEVDLVGICTIKVKIRRGRQVMLVFVLDKDIEVIRRPAKGRKAKDNANPLPDDDHTDNL